MMTEKNLTTMPQEGVGSGPGLTLDRVLFAGLLGVWFATCAAWLVIIAAMVFR
jgi:hypothetical protein